MIHLVTHGSTINLVFVWSHVYIDSVLNYNLSNHSFIQKKNIIKLIWTTIFLCNGISRRKKLN